MFGMLRRAAGTRVAARAAEDSGGSVTPALCSRGLFKGSAHSEGAASEPPVSRGCLIR